MIFKHTTSFLFLIVSTVALTSCGSSSKEQNKTEADFQNASDTLKDQIKEVVYNIPSPSEIPYLLKATGAEYNEALLNTRTNVDKYVAHHDKAALNLGVYAADIGYLSSYDKTQQSIDYLNAAKILADNLGVIGAFDIDILKRFESNIANKDSLSRVLDETIKNTESFLMDDTRDNLSALVVAGSFIEGLYISTGIIKSYPKNLLPSDKRNLILTPVVRVVLEQEKSVTELLKMMKAVDQNGAVATIVADLSELEKIYKVLDIEEQMKNNQADQILTNKNLESITQIVDKLRSGIVQ